MTRVLSIDPDRPDPDVISDAAAVLSRGGLVAFPTETVYGLGASALEPSAIARLFTAKGRPATDPLIVHLAHIGQLGRVARDISPVARTLGLAFWAGPLTIILHKQAVVSDAVTAGRATVAVRVPAHRIARALLEACGVPVAAPSANRFSRPSPTRAEHVVADLDGLVDLVLDGGATPIGVESTIVDCTRTPPVLVRPGGITYEQLLTHVPDLIVEQREAAPDQPQVAPGQLLRHYAPEAPVTLFVGEPAVVQARIGADARALAAKGQRVGILAPEEDILALAPFLAAPATSGRVLLRAYGRRDDPAAAAHVLFDVLRALDAEQPDVILAADVGPAAVGAAIFDRLMRAAEGRVVRAGSRS
jgi:L-threonylcarbamoyladenylate synthase